MMMMMIYIYNIYIPEKFVPWPSFLHFFHRGRLRRIIGIRWPKVISNDELCKRCDSKPLNETVKRFRL